MLMKERIRLVETVLEEKFPDAHCELIHRNAFELTVAVALSAQTTDVAVNKVTKYLFRFYPTPETLMNADVTHVESLIKTIGLYKTKARNIIALARSVVIDFGGIIPNTEEKLVMLPGVGKKTAEVVLGTAFQIPAFPVDTHVLRLSHRFGLAKATLTNPDKMSDLLKKRFAKNKWISLHHQFIFYGRYFCKAKNPNCNECDLFELCKDKIKFSVKE